MNDRYDGSSIDLEKALVRYMVERRVTRRELLERIAVVGSAAALAPVIAACTSSGGAATAAPSSAAPSASASTAVASPSPTECFAFRAPRSAFELALVSRLTRFSCTRRCSTGFRMREKRAAGNRRGRRQALPRTATRCHRGSNCLKETC